MGGARLCGRGPSLTPPLASLREPLASELPTPPHSHQSLQQLPSHSHRPTPHPLPHIAANFLYLLVCRATPPTTVDLIVAEIMLKYQVRTLPRRGGSGEKSRPSILEEGEESSCPAPSSVSPVSSSSSSSSSSDNAGSAPLRPPRRLSAARLRSASVSSLSSAGSSESPSLEWVCVLLPLYSFLCTPSSTPYPTPPCLLHSRLLCQAILSPSSTLTDLPAQFLSLEEGI